MNRFFRIGLGILILSVLLSVTACCTWGLKYDQTEYTKLSDLKTAAPLLMDKAKESSQNHSAEIARLRVQLKEAYDFATNRCKDSEVTKNLARLSDPSRPLLVWFLNKWEKEGTVEQLDIESTESNIDQILSISIDEEKSFKQ